jgi:glutathione peroxidase
MVLVSCSKIAASRRIAGFPVQTRPAVRGRARPAVACARPIARKEPLMSTPSTTAWDFEANTLTGKPMKLSAFRGKVALIVNTASQCGLTPQYQGLQALYDRFASRGLVVLGFPSNQFGQQEPGSSTDIAQFCEVNFGVSFPMFEKIDVNGDAAHPLYRWLKAEKPGALGIEAIKWNFSKFLVDREGQVVERYAPTTEPAAIAADIERLLG